MAAHRHTYVFPGAPSRLRMSAVTAGPSQLSVTRRRTDGPDLAEVLEVRLDDGLDLLTAVGASFGSHPRDERGDARVLVDDSEPRRVLRLVDRGGRLQALRAEVGHVPAHQVADVGVAQLGRDLRWEPFADRQHGLVEV